MMDIIGYCIAKSSRYSAGQQVTRHPFYNIQPPYIHDYERLRCTVYDTVEDAQSACDEIKQYNPVGFVVVELVATTQPPPSTD